MRLIRTLCRTEGAEIESGCELLSRVTRLVDCLERPEREGEETLRDAVEEALTAAIDAEKRLAEQDKRVQVLERLAKTDELTGLLKPARLPCRTPARLVRRRTFTTNAAC